MNFASRVFIFLLIHGYSFFCIAYDLNVSNLQKIDALAAQIKDVDLNNVTAQDEQNIGNFINAILENVEQELMILPIYYHEKIKKMSLHELLAEKNNVEQERLRYSMAKRIKKEILATYEKKSLLLDDAIFQKKEETSATWTDLFANYVQKIVDFSKPDPRYVELE